MSRRFVTAALLAMSALPSIAAEQPAAGLTCEQLYAVAQSAVKYRDQGYSLAQVLGGLKSLQSEGKLTPGEIETLRRVITLAYMGNAAPEEIGLECMNVQGTRKP